MKTKVEIWPCVAPLVVTCAILVAGCEKKKANHSPVLSIESCERRLGLIDAVFVFPMPPSLKDVPVWAGLPTPKIASAPFQSSIPGTSLGSKLPPFDPPAGTAPVDSLATLSEVANISEEDRQLAPVLQNPIGKILTPAHLDAIGRAVIEGGKGYADVNSPLYVEGAFNGLIPPLRWQRVWRITSARVDPCFGNYAKVVRMRDSILSGAQVPPGKMDPQAFEEYWSSNLKECTATLRVIISPLLLSPIPLVVNDVAIHLVYKLTPRELLALGNDLLALKKEFNPGCSVAPVSVHPGFKWSGPTPPFSTLEEQSGDHMPTEAGIAGFRANQLIFKKMHNFIFKHAAVGRLHHASYFSTSAKNGTLTVSLWTYHDFDFKQSPHGGEKTVEVKKIPYVQDNVQAFVAHQNTVEKIFIPMIRFPEKWDDTVALAQLALGSSNGISMDGNPSIIPILDESYRIENPLKNNFRSTDCVSCHTSYPLRMMLIRKLPDAEQRLFDASGYPIGTTLRSKFSNIYDNPLLPPVRIESKKNAYFAYFPAGNDEIKDFFSFRDKFAIESFKISYIQRHLGYFGRYPATTPRMNNEAAEAAAFMNLFLVPSL